MDEVNPYLGREVGTSLRLTMRPISRLQSDLSLTMSRFTDPRNDDAQVFNVGYDDHYRQELFVEDLEEQRFLSSEYRRTNRAIFTKLQYLFRY